MPPSWVTVVVAIITFIIGPLILAWYSNKTKRENQKNNEAVQEAVHPIDYASRYIEDLYNQIEKLEQENLRLEDERDKFYESRKHQKQEFYKLQLAYETEKLNNQHNIDLLKQELAEHTHHVNNEKKILEDQIVILKQENKILKAEIEILKEGPTDGN